MARVRNRDTERKKTDDQHVWRVAVYIRLSREDGGDESESVANQRKILNEYLEHSFEGRYTVADHYIDDGLTGTDDTRADFMRMVRDIEQGKVNCILCKTLARAFRNYSDQGYYLEYYFQQKNIRFISTGDPKVDTYTNPEAITGLEVPITGLMNDRFAGRTSSDVRRTFNMKRRNGEYIGAFPPYGYLKHPDNKNRLVLDEEIVPVKKDMYRWLVIDGMSLAGIARRLNELGVPNPTAYKRSKGWSYNNPHAADCDGLWVGTTVKRVLLDKVNLGHMVQGKQRVVSYKVHDRVQVPKDEWFVKADTHEATFTQDEYDTLERLLRRDTRTANGERQVHLFAGFLRCRDCGKALQRKSAKSHVYYSCRTYTEKSKERCTRHGIRADRLEKAVLAAVQAQIALLNSPASIAEDIAMTPFEDTQSARLDKLLREKRRELEKARTLTDGLYADWKSGDITRDDYRRMKIKYEGQIKQTELTIKSLEGERERAARDQNRESAAFAEFKKNGNIQALDRAALVEFVDTIYVHENKEITIEFRFASEPAAYFYREGCG